MKRYIDKGLGILFRYLPFALFLLVLLFSFFARPAAEDLSIHHYDKVFGVSGNIRSFYHNECSRYFSFPLIFVLLDGRFLLMHYYLVALLLLLSLWGVFFLSARSLGRVLFSAGLSGEKCAWLSTVLLLAIYSTLFQPAGVIYWISGSMTYLLSFILFALLMMLLLRAAGRGRMAVRDFIFVLLLGVAAAGSNEITLFLLILSLLWVQAVYYSVYGKLWRVVNLIGLIVAGCFIAFIIPGGTRHRAGNFMLNFSIGHGVLVGIVYGCWVMIRALQSPLVWLCMVMAGYAGSVTGPAIRKRLAGSKPFHPLVFLAAIPSGVMFFYFMVYTFSGEILPGRAKDLLLFYIFFLLLAAAFSYGLRSGFGIRAVPDLFRHPVAKLCVVAVFLASGLVRGAISNLVSGYLYNQVMDKREKVIAEARDKGEHTVTLSPYADDHAAVLQDLPKPVKQLAGKAGMYPSFIFYSDPLADTALYIHFYAGYEGIDSINYLGRRYGKAGMEKSEQIK